MKITNLTADEAALDELGRRVAKERLARSMTQAQMAEAAGISKRTIERLEDGGSIQLGNLVRCLRALDRLDALDQLIPETPPNPIALLERGGKTRQRARSDNAITTTKPWTWGDEQ